MDELKLATIQIGSADYQEFNDIFCDSFEPYDRPESLAQLIKLCKQNPNTLVLGAYDGDVPVGVVNYAAFDDFIYLLFFCVDSKIRSKGYGSALIKALIAHNPNLDIIGCGEIKNKNEDKSVQNAARRRFYERNGFVYTKYTYWENNMQFAAMTNGKPDDVPAHIRTILENAGDSLSEEEAESFKNIADC